MVVYREADIVRADGRGTVVSVVREIRGTASMYILDDGLGDVQLGSHLASPPLDGSGARVPGDRCEEPMCQTYRPLRPPLERNRLAGWPGACRSHLTIHILA